MDLSIIIVNWNSKEYLRDCLLSLNLADWNGTHEVIVIDAGSFDGCEQMMNSEFPDARFIQSTENLGFARANNVAFRASRGRTLLFLNPDTKVVGSAIQQMLQVLGSLENPGVLGCRLLNRDGSLQTSCVQAFPTITNQLLDSDFLRDRWPNSRLWGIAALYRTSEQPAEVEAISGACLMMRREVFERVGLLSEEYFMYAEDIDLAFKCREQGLRNYYLSTAEVFHFGGTSSDQAPSEFAVVMMRDSIWKFLRKSRGALYAAIFRVATIFNAAARLALIKIGGWFVHGEFARARKWRAVLRWGMNPSQSVAAFMPSSLARSAELEMTAS